LSCFCKSSVSSFNIVIILLTRETEVSSLYIHQSSIVWLLKFQEFYSPISSVLLDSIWDLLCSVD
jgi:hypothetical protein